MTCVHATWLRPRPWEPMHLDASELTLVTVGFGSRLCENGCFIANHVR
jgi:hypothetical protein